MLEMLQAHQAWPQGAALSWQIAIYLTIELMTIELEAGNHEKNLKHFVVVQVIHEL